MWSHPETKENEIYLGNTLKEVIGLDTELKPLKTVRFVDKAYDSEGNLLPKHVAMMIDKSEHDEYNKIQDLELKKIGLTNRIKYYRDELGYDTKGNKIFISGMNILDL